MSRRRRKNSTGWATPTKPFVMVGPTRSRAGPARRQNERAGDNAGQDDEEDSPGGVSRRRALATEASVGGSVGRVRQSCDRRCPQEAATGSAWASDPAAALVWVGAWGRGRGRLWGRRRRALSDQARPDRCPRRGRTSAPASPARTAGDDRADRNGVLANGDRVVPVRSDSLMPGVPTYLETNHFALSSRRPRVNANANARAIVTAPIATSRVSFIDACAPTQRLDLGYRSCVPVATDADVPD